MEQRTKRGVGRTMALGGVFALAAMGMTGCDVSAPDNKFFHFIRMGWPEGITPEAHSMGNFWVWTWVTAWIIGIIMWGIFLYAIFGKWNAKKAEKRGDGEFPRQLQYNIPLEMVLTILPILIVMGLFFFTVQAQDKVTARDKNPQVKVDVTAFQWNWKFGYEEVAGSLTTDGQVYKGTDETRTKQAEKASVNPGEDAVNPIHGKAMSDKSYLKYDQIETVGSTEEVPVLVLPSNTPIEFNLASADVTHAFWVPEFLFKRDAYAHPEANSSERTFQIEKIDKEGAFVGRCAEMCGTYHAMMNFEVRVVSPEKFKDYIEYRRTHPDAPNSEALGAIGQPKFATSTHPFSSLRDTRDGNNINDPTGVK
ncbi:cytochrome B [Corynebacterium poyangense]|uniref:cytochrome-c oxidase n=1 Tax=Corynebacterium poyangense TaxID=2684405 RepID=A0A7H0SPV9_9CORY|nr:cytochrome c oxidase subunit II [Corynebacterium poyangense]MBZ8178177.1 cytochrome B [Corynebacterium poyangense]QNQ90584.1 cytochrome B [Corynebacterium poyangense]